MRSVSDSLSVTYDAEPAAVGRARTAVAEFAASVGATPDQVDAVRLVTSEAVTNAVLHAYRGAPGQIEVVAVVSDSELWVQVADDGGGMAPEPDRPGLGLGLGLISQVSDEMAIVSRSSGGTEVRARFAIPATRGSREQRATRERSSAPIAPGQVTVRATPSPVAACPID